MGQQPNRFCSREDPAPLSCYLTCRIGHCYAILEGKHTMSLSKLKKKRQGRSEEQEVRALLRDPEVQESIRRGREDFRKGRYRTLDEYLAEHEPATPPLQSSQEA